ncbi:MAG: YjzC family protein [Erysipelotrichaceae bacterium]|nr:YjzC family protein [Erysipelotrichaceae bacterium]
MARLIKPGTDNEPKGKYREVGPRGGQVPSARTVEIDQGDRLPPTQKSGNRWVKDK